MKKIFRTLDEQVEILQKKGLIVEDVEYAKTVLLRENYFFINGYRSLFVNPSDNGVFLKGTKFRELYAMFYFDRQVRNTIFKNILIIENNLKSIISYVTSKNYGFKEKKYLDVKNFTSDPERKLQVQDLIKKMKRQIRVNGGQHSATQHYITKYGYIPMWVVVKVLSFGIVSELFTIMKSEDQDEVVDIFKINKESFLVYLPLLANYRNLCAHEDILYNNRTQRSIPDTKYHQLLNIPMVEDEYIYGKNDLFTLIIIMKQILNKTDFNWLVKELNYEIQKLSGRLETIEINAVLHKMGFPENFFEILEVE